ncbi:response regulator [Azotosporobacter soli]|uniref:response regulator n=1 Tax=Azotosporobacter soli TaxID=3055040 RepID=UPI0031FE974D
METQSGIKVLVVDDSGFSRTLIGKELNRAGIENQQIKQAASGEEAVVQMQTTRFELFILDIIMTGIDGIAVLKEVKKTQPDAKIIMCSGTNSEDVIKEIVRLGIDAFIVKPYRSETFDKVLRRILDLPREVSGEWSAKCHVCDAKMVEVDSIDMVSFFCPQTCMKIGPLSNVLVTQAELDQDYAAAKK